MELIVDVGRLESRFFPFGDSVSVGVWFALGTPLAQKIILDALDGTTR